MLRATILFSLIGHVTAGHAASSCKCQLTLSVCNEVAATDVVFIGTVQSIEPNFLDAWNANQSSSLGLLNKEYARVQGDRSAASFVQLREAYLKVFPDLPEEHRKKLAAASSPAQLAELFYWILDHGKRVRLRVKTVFRGELASDDDDDHDDDAGDAAKTVEIWTPFGDCGFSFQVGETYLVYADDDEESDAMSTGSCTRTRRISDAGDDLAYLYFYKHNGDAASRLEGFVTSDLLYLRERDLAHYVDRIGAPVSGAVVELKSVDLKQADLKSAQPPGSELKGASLRRIALSDAQGRFVFDGLPAGEFTVNAFASGYPVVTRALAGPKSIPVGNRACASQVLVAPDADSDKARK
jgi:hypothetical protein